MLRDMQELGTWVFSMHMEQPCKKEGFLPFLEVEASRGRKICNCVILLLCIEVKFCWKKTFLSEMLYADVKHLGCCTNPNKKKKRQK